MMEWKYFDGSAVGLTCEGNSISKLQIQVANYVFELSAGKLSPLDSSTI